MTLEEKTKFIAENKSKNYLFVSPRAIQGGAVLVCDYETLELYESMDENTEKFAEREIVNLVSTAKCNKSAAQNYLNLTLIFCGNFHDLPDNIGRPTDFIMNNKEKFVAVYKYVKNTEQVEFFVGFAQSKTIYNYGYLYLNLAKLLDEFDKNNIKYEIDTAQDRNIPSAYIDERITKFLISYSPEKVES